MAAGVRNDTERAIRTLSQFAARDDVGDASATMVRGWIQQLGNFDVKVAAGSELSAARTIIDEGRAATRFSQGPQPAGDVHRGGDNSAPLPAVQTGEQRRRGRGALPAGSGRVLRFRVSYWISETDHLLEQAIRRSPGAPVAKEAYEFLEEYMMSGYSVTARKIPEGEEKRLEELRELIANANG